MCFTETSTTDGIRFLAACLLMIVAPAGVFGETRAIRFAGECDLTQHDSIQTALRVRAAGRMQYAAHIACKSFVRGDWIISPRLVVANPTESALHCAYFVAFYDEDGRLVGCCNQDGEVRSGAEMLQFGSCIIHGPKARLLQATRFEAVIYESDQPVGIEPVSADAVDRKLAEAPAIAARLEDVETATDDKDGWTARRLTTDVTYRPADERQRDGHVFLDETYDLWFRTGLQDVSVARTRNGKRTVSEYAVWRTEAELDRRKRDRSIRYHYHAAVNDAKGRLVVCSTYTGGRFLDAPPDPLLSARKLEAVVYELPARK